MIATPYHLVVWMVKKISISIPEELLRLLDEAAEEEGVSRSRLIVEAISSHLAGRRGRLREPRIYPTVLWKLRAYGGRRLRSPRRVGRRIEDEWIIEEYQGSICT